MRSIKVLGALVVTSSIMPGLIAASGCITKTNPSIEKDQDLCAIVLTDDINSTPEINTHFSNPNFRTIYNVNNQPVVVFTAYDKGTPYFLRATIDGVSKKGNISNTINEIARNIANLSVEYEVTPTTPAIIQSLNELSTSKKGTLLTNFDSNVTNKVVGGYFIVPRNDSQVRPGKDMSALSDYSVEFVTTYSDKNGHVLTNLQSFNHFEGFENSIEHINSVVANDVIYPVSLGYNLDLLGYSMTYKNPYGDAAFGTNLTLQNESLQK